MAAESRFLLDENVPGPLTAAIHWHWPDAVRVQDVGMLGSPDEAILEWAFGHQFLLISGDRRTLERIALARILRGDQTAGILLLRPQQKVDAVLEDLRLIRLCTVATDWVNRIEFIPF